MITTRNLRMKVPRAGGPGPRSGEPNWMKEKIKERQARPATLALKVWPDSDGVAQQSHAADPATALLRAASCTAASVRR
jgi:hypothetical protein